jgi:hypothetical protein
VGLRDDYQIRQSLRRKLQVPVLIFQESGERIAQGFTLDVSKGGAKLKVDRSIDLPPQFLISLSERGEVQRLCRVVWRMSGEVGVRFIQARPKAAPVSTGH